MKILIAGMGNVLRHDDGFGVEVARRLTNDWAPSGAVRPNGVDVHVIEVGIGGIHLVQELMGGYDALMIVDAVERGSPPGTVHVLEAEVPDLASWADAERQAFLADTHYTTPSKALILAKALNVLPPKAFIIGCQPVEAFDMGLGLSATVEQAVQCAIREIEVLVQRLAMPTQEVTTA